MKKNLLIAQCLALIFGASLYSACGDCELAPSDSVFDYRFTFNLVDKVTGKNLIASRDHLYTPFVMRMTDMNGKVLEKSRFNVGSDGVFAAFYVEQDTLRGSVLKDSFLVTFPSDKGEIGKGDKDTIKYEYILQMNEKCGNLQVSNLKVFFNNVKNYDGKEFYFKPLQFKK